MSDHGLLLLFLALLAACAIALIVLGVRLARGWRSLQVRARAVSAQAGERAAEQMLRAAGWKVVARQARAQREVEVDGQLYRVELRADLLVERRGARCVAEVKTGELVPDPLYPPTRRQLMEYLVVFGGDRVLLVDVPGRRVREVVFPDLET